jgi:hypothetical protein
LLVDVSRALLSVSVSDEKKAVDEIGTHKTGEDSGPTQQPLIDDGDDPRWFLSHFDGDAEQNGHNRSDVSFSGDFETPAATNATPPTKP